jgi:hypothetical protein
MRDFFILWFERLVGVIIILAGLAVLIGGVATMAGATGQPGGVAAGLAILVGGTIYVVFLGGALYLGLGIYQNTKRAAEALERRQQG